MAGASRQQLLATFKDLLASGAFSDLTLTCGADTYRVHKNIVCSRADFFARAVKFGGKETEQGQVDLPDDEPFIVKLLIQYIYEGEYEPCLPDDDYSSVVATETKPTSKKKHRNSHTYNYGFPHSCLPYRYSCNDPNVCPHHTCGSHCGYQCAEFTCATCKPNPPTIQGPPDQLITHAKMYEIADKYNVTGLKELVKEKFNRACQNFWDDANFAIAAHHAFSTTPETDKGLRDVVSKTIAEHMEALVKKPEVETLLTEFNGLAFRLLKMKMEAGWK
ncbi:hypothetical protein DDE82_003395 [Stemphylium lycopersici]|uniref:BTB domain-containing protein n=1 Tax=Stemphylium lycopersici TaxID=183478 RepID=A0A364N8Q2_STELY|nr:hypothetical protein TW65_02092 [Stemphylium lycopersici]RAR06326.1 hypothetical protein DDE82_003395 [Stemphylium lycopersici]RAR13679.1 hypothetical protein DDE83_003002 [Stemphylium lycopersici]